MRATELCTFKEGIGSNFNSGARSVVSVRMLLGGLLKGGQQYLTACFNVRACNGPSTCTGLAWQTHLEFLPRAHRNICAMHPDCSPSIFNGLLICFDNTC